MADDLSTLDAHALLRWAAACVSGLERRRDEINVLNVFPIADSDTGTNLHFTMAAALRAAEQANGGTEPTVQDLATALARGAVAGARGNSGVILSQLLRGVAEASSERSIDGNVLKDALEAALDLVSKSLSNVVEGTVVTVLRGAAQAARATDECALADVTRAAADGAASALEQTPRQLSVLSQAGVVDAGGLGLVVILDALVGVVTGDEPQRPRFTVRATVGDTTTSASATAPAADARPVEHIHEYATGDAEYEVMYLLDGSSDHAADALREKLSDLGDSVVVVGDGSGVWSVHVHSADPGAAIEVGLAAGKPRDIRITAFAPDQQVSFAATPTRPLVRMVLALVTGGDAAELFESEGATVLRTGGMASPQELLDAILALRADEVFVLPNGLIKAEELVAVSTQARQLGHPAVLLPTSSMVQGLAALAVHDPSRVASDDSYAMAAAAAATRWGSVRRADSRALTMAGVCEPGDCLGLVGREVLVIDEDLAVATAQLADLMLAAGGELVTVLAGQDGAGTYLADTLEKHIKKMHPGIDLMVYPGGQDDDILQIGVE
ncbi:DAK2 domain-containing protein [Hoyosella altamirensis]|uniref:DhaL domain-containing protein n=1 Tax=Hoyosella altamirensis TaxID=616997 RepID=A0A839RJB3_9ACTN|nr:DAK2 domain-containing protein [Hoyosella altamirensis]MBB3036264.1 hypothetical protein [Hoyosella altamirensis]